MCARLFNTIFILQCTAAAAAATACKYNNIVLSEGARAREIAQINALAVVREQSRRIYHHRKSGTNAYADHADVDYMRRAGTGIVVLCAGYLLWCASIRGRNKWILSAPQWSFTRARADASGMSAITYIRQMCVSSSLRCIWRIILMAV